MAGSPRGELEQEKSLFGSARERTDGAGSPSNGVEQRRMDWKVILLCKGKIKFSCENMLNFRFFDPEEGVCNLYYLITLVTLFYFRFVSALILV